MKRVTQGGDISFNISSVRGLGDTYAIKFYTTNADNFIMKTNGDVVDGIIALNWSELETLGNGVVNYTVDDNTIDTEYSDGLYNRTFGGTTDYYIDNLVSEESDIDILTARLNAEINRSITKDDELSAAIVDETTARVNADNDLSERINDNSTAIANTYTKQEVNDLLEEIDIELPDNIVVDANYVHTDNNFTESEKNKLDGIASGAEVNVQSDWNVTNTSSDAYIKNKPTKVSEFTNDAGYLKSYTETDPVFVASAAHSIKSSDISNWNSKTSNIGTITGIEMNGQTKGTSGIVNLGTIITEETDPTVPSWAKSPNKPSYTASEVGALPASTVVPTKISQLIDDSDFVEDPDYVHTDNNFTTSEKEKLTETYTKTEINDKFSNVTTNSVVLPNNVTIGTTLIDLSPFLTITDTLSEDAITLLPIGTTVLTEAGFSRIETEGEIKYSKYNVIIPTSETAIIIFERTTDAGNYEPISYAEFNKSDFADVTRIRWNREIKFPNGESVDLTTLESYSKIILTFIGENVTNIAKYA